MARRRWIDLAVAAALFVLVLLGALTAVAAHQGLTYDEPVYAGAAERHWAWFGAVARHGAAAWQPYILEQHWGNAGPTPVEADWHPALGKLLHAAARRLPWPGGPLAAYRAGSALAFAFTAALLFFWLAGAHSRAAGAAAALAFITMPRAAGHAGIAALDMPVTAAATLATYAGWRLLRQPGWWAGAAFGLAVAMAASTKFNGVLAVPPVLLLALWRRPALGPLALGLLLVAPLTGWLLWPWLWYDGWQHLQQVLAFHGRHAYIATAYFGRVYTDPPPPWHYPAVLLAITTPLPTLLAAPLGLRPTRPQRLLAGLLAGTLLCHVLPYALPGAAKYNGVRLFLPALPLLAALSGLGAAGLAARWPHWRRALLVALLLLLSVPGLAGLLAVFPYPLAYYSPLVGGPAGAVRRGFEATYWGEAFRGPLAWLSAHAEPGATVYVQPPGAIAMLQMYRGLGLLRDDLRLVHGQDADWYLYQNRASEWDERGRELARRTPAYTELAGGAPVAFVWRR